MSGHPSTWKYGGKHVTKVCAVRMPNGKVCGREHHANGMCQAHYNRVRRHGDPQPEKPIRSYSEQKKWPLEALLDRHEVDPETGCWLWTGKTNAYGYGRLYFNGKEIMAHRVAYAKFHGLTLEDIEEDWICHHCDRPLCCRPEHLYKGDAQTNREDRELTDLSIEERRALRTA